ncbi:hypothetical protein OIU80_05510 [Flavobacterium sp. LS1R47]|uniref:Uncharacterized protein n=1 Tax=Flavobacterium frigoritolerans TaxID=2987686 RepID=A0A9X2ZQ32_9FLAO|nr:hypothetical protein [Flavobacterium frigoritolerans]MCV9931733.1 hypothetical protein [Flavobacterium frigoritolerans]
MNNDQITNRIALLYLALQFCSEQMKMFTAGERICINQERFQWLHILSEPEAEPRPVSIAIEAKISNVIKLIETHKFKPSYEDPFNNEIVNTL